MKMIPLVDAFKLTLKNALYIPLSSVFSSAFVGLVLFFFAKILSDKPASVPLAAWLAGFVIVGHFLAAKGLLAYFFASTGLMLFNKEALWVLILMATLIAVVNGCLLNSGSKGWPTLDVTRWSFPLVMGIVGALTGAMHWVMHRFLVRFLVPESVNTYTFGKGGDNA